MSKVLFNIKDVIYKSSISIVASILFILYSHRITSELPNTLRIFFENSIARFSIIVIIIYLGNNNLEISFLVALSIMIIMMFVHKYDIKESLTNKIHNDFYLGEKSLEHFENTNSNLTSENSNKESTDVESIDVENNLGQDLLDNESENESASDSQDYINEGNRKGMGKGKGMGRGKGKGRIAENQKPPKHRGHGQGKGGSGISQETDTLFNNNFDLAESESESESNSDSDSENNHNLLSHSDTHMESEIEKFKDNISNTSNCLDSVNHNIQKSINKYKNMIN